MRRLLSTVDHFMVLGGLGGAWEGLERSLGCWKTFEEALKSLAEASGGPFGDSWKRSGGFSGSIECLWEAFGEAWGIFA